MSRSSRQISLPFIRIDRKNRRPVYEQIFDGIREGILHGRLQPNDRLPATRLIAEELGVSRNIVVMAFEQLVMEGYIRSQSGSGSFVAAEVPVGMEAPKGRVGTREGRVSEFSGLIPRLDAHVTVGDEKKRLGGSFVD